MTPQLLELCILCLESFESPKQRFRDDSNSISAGVRLRLSRNSTSLDTASEGGDDDEEGEDDENEKDDVLESDLGTCREYDRGLVIVTAAVVEVGILDSGGSGGKGGR